MLAKAITLRDRISTDRTNPSVNILVLGVILFTDINALPQKLKSWIPHG